MSLTNRATAQDARLLGTLDLLAGSRQSPSAPQSAKGRPVESGPPPSHSRELSSSRSMIRWDRPMSPTISPRWPRTSFRSTSTTDNFRFVSRATSATKFCRNRSSSKWGDDAIRLEARHRTSAAGFAPKARGRSPGASDCHDGPSPGCSQRRTFGPAAGALPQLSGQTDPTVAKSSFARLLSSLCAGRRFLVRDFVPEFQEARPIRAVAPGSPRSNRPFSLADPPGKVHSMGT